jgi:hypothetical protein
MMYKSKMRYKNRYKKGVGHIKIKAVKFGMKKSKYGGKKNSKWSSKTKSLSRYGKK